MAHSRAVEYGTQLLFLLNCMNMNFNMHGKRKQFCLFMCIGITYNKNKLSVMIKLGR